MKIFGVRAQLIGDQVMALPVLNILKKKYPSCKITWAVAQKVKQAAFFWGNHPLIHDVIISKDKEGNEYDVDFKDYDLVIDVNPKPTCLDPYNHMNCVEQAVAMAGFNLNDPFLGEEERVPKLYYPWLNYSKANNSYKIIGIFPFAGYGSLTKRSPSVEWWNKMIEYLNINNYRVIHFGHYSEPRLDNTTNFTNLDFHDQIKYALHCNSIIGTDSGSMWAMGAYNLIPCYTLLTYHMPNHNMNPLALNPVNCTPFFDSESCDNIEQEYVFKHINSNNSFKR